ncbi:MAG: DUF3883 domain-containing protein [Candidatus Diapherotrites archaeon]|nr:DUF3883 domain-containing protein [Candidatus Diapherotrites archaeon]
MAHTKPQTVDFLGFLSGQLQGLQGITTLCYELIQNADDVRDEAGNPGASRITFDVCDDALWVENDGVFRERDFERMQRLSWGDKRREANTIGAFGIGFISVYQITDAPEIFSSGLHWIFRPEKKENERILEEEIPTENTRFRLPWAFKDSPVRQALQIPPISREVLERYTEEIGQAIEHAALFLRQITTLEVKRNGVLRRRIEVVKEAERYLIDDGETTTEWQIFQGNLNGLKAYHDLRSKFGGLLENRDIKVELAIPESPVRNGRLYAFLPSETFTGLPFHINADFFPSSDRKRILLDGDYQADWNRLALNCAVETLARNIDGLLDLFPDLATFWRFVAQVKQAEEGGPLHPNLPPFWEQMRAGVATRPTVLTTRQQKKRPGEVYYPVKSNEAQAAAIFEDLGLPILNPSLREFQNLLTSKEVGVKILKMQDVLEAMESAHFDRPRALADFPPSLRNRDNWSQLWGALQSLEVDESAATRLQHLSIVFGEDGRLYPPTMLLAEPEQKVRDFFSAIAPKVVWLSPQMKSDVFPGNLVPKLDFRRGLELLEENTGRLPDVLKETKHLKTLYAWLSKHKEELKRAPNLVNRIRALPIGPTATGQFKPLEQLFLTGEFEDPLQLAEVLDLSQISEHGYLIKEILGVSTLNLETYIQKYVPRVWPKISSEKRVDLVRLLTQRLGQLKPSSELREILQEIPLALCDDGQFRVPAKVYFDPAPARTLMGARTAVLDRSLAQDAAIRDFYKWVGVADEIRPEDLLAFVQSTTQSPPSAESIEKIPAVFQYLAQRWKSLDEKARERFAPLKSIPWLPGSMDNDRWFLPNEVYADFQKYLFESQGNFLQIKNSVQRQAKEFIRFLGVKTTPEPDLVIRHLRYCAQHNIPVNKEVYKYLNKVLPNEAVSLLKGTACLYIESDSGEVRYYRPNEVFLGEHPFGAYRLQLPKEFYEYRKFLETIGVKEKPDPHDAIAVLQEISESEVAKSHLPVGEESEIAKVLFAAWEILNKALVERHITSETIYEALHGRECILNKQRILYKPEWLFFEDRPGWAEKFTLVAENITPRIKDTWQAMEAAGVRRLSTVVQTTLADLETTREDVTNIATLLNERGILLRRVLDISGKTVDYSEILGEITFVQASKIVVTRTLEAFNRQEDKSESVDAVYLPDEKKLYYVPIDNRPPWAGIARELTYAVSTITQGEDENASQIPLALEKILSGSSFEKVSQEFDALGFPPIEDSLVDKAAPAKAHAWGGDAVDAVIEETYPDEAEREKTPAAPQQARLQSSLSAEKASSANSQPKRKPHSPRRDAPRTTEHLISYVLSQERAREERPLTRKTRNQEIGRLGVGLVMEFERRQGRQPEDMNATTPNNPGYDIRSYSPETGETRYIEVKALTQLWDGRNPARMTHTEFETAVERGEKYWLYVIENVESELPRLYCIQNPAEKVQYFCYDHGWREVSISAEGYLIKKHG